MILFNWFQKLSRLFYCSFQINETPHNPGNWHDVILKPSGGETFSHTMSYDIRGLEPGSSYEAIVQAKNRYGWNEVSESMQFYTRGPSEESYGKLFYNKIFNCMDNYLEPDIF